MDDDALLAAVAVGDSTALRDIFTRHAPWIAGRLRRSLPPDAVEDVLQETFVAVWRSAGRYGGQGEVGAWIWGIARRQAALWARKDGPGADAQALDLFTTADFSSAAAAHADWEQACAALGPEGDERRDLARMVFVEDRSVAEVAAHFDVPPGTIKSRLWKLRQVLRAALGEGE